MRTDKTPGVYIEERLVLGNSVVPVPTAIPAFVGYTQKNEFNGQSLARKPIKVTSMVEFVTLFGGGYTTKFDVTEAKQGTPDIILGNPSKGYTLTANAATPRFLLYDSIRFFYANGGGDCYIVSMGTYETDGKAATMLKKDFEDGIQHFCADFHGYKTIITRNVKDYYKSSLSVLTPKEFLANFEK